MLIGTSLLLVAEVAIGSLKKRQRMCSTSGGLVNVERYEMESVWQLQSVLRRPLGPRK